MDINTDEPLKELKTLAMEYIELKIESLRLSLAEIAAYFFVAIVSIIIISMALLSVFISISFFIGHYLHSYEYGFLVSAAMYLLLLWYFLTIGKRKLESRIIKKILELTEINSTEIK